MGSYLIPSKSVYYYAERADELYYYDPGRSDNWLIPGCCP